jgi:flagellar biosynthetic protein FlhB
VGSAAPLVPDFSRINPAQGMQRLFSLRGLAELVKALLKCALLTGVAYHFLRTRLPEIALLSTPGGLASLAVIGRTLWELMLRMALAGGFIAAVDYLFQRRIFEQRLRMTKQDLKEELRRSEGDPLLKSRLRRLQLQFARGRMMQQVAKATVVVTNPTHLAVALRYHPGEHPAPRVVAKGMRLVAERIKEEALRHRVPVIENQPLARALYDTTDLGRPIPVDLYQAVAEIIAFVLRLTGRVPGGVR